MKAWHFLREDGCLKYPPHTKVEVGQTLGGEIIEDENKVVARTRRVIAMVDASTVLHEFACDVAEAALAKVEDPDPRSVAAIAAKRAWLRGECSDEDLRAAWDAAWAAWGAASAASAAACAAAHDAACDAAWDAAWAASASRGAARAAQDADLTGRLVKLLALEEE